MDELTNEQLFAIIRNEQLNAEIRSSATKEFTKRDLSPEEIAEIVYNYEQSFAGLKHKQLLTLQKLLLVIYPFPVTVYSIFFHRYGKQGKTSRMKPYLKFILLGYILWTVCVLGLVYVFRDS